MQTPEKNRKRSTATPLLTTPTSPFSVPQSTGIPNTFFDPPTVNHSLTGTQLREPSSFSFASCPEGTAATGATSSSDTACRRGEVYRRGTAGGTVTNATSRVHSLESVAASMKTSVVGSGPPSSTSASAVAAQAFSTLTRAALAEYMEPPAAPRDDAVNLEQRNSLPLLPMGDPAAAAAAATPTASTMITLTSAALRPSEEAEGSIHVATRASRHRGPSDLSSLTSGQGLQTSEFASGFELSMESVTLQIFERRYFRLHPVTYLDECSLHISPGSMHCVASLNPMYARTALAVLAGVDTATGAARGATLANALPTSSQRYRRRVAYVASLDCCTEEATVYENLAFATRIRFLVDEQALRETVKQAASDAFLTDHLHTRASDLGLARRYLLATAMELVAEPTVLLLDDPLSFFSLAELQLFTQLLHSMRRRNPARTVVWSCSAIPWTLFDSIDGLTLLTTGGKTFYTGSKANVEAFLQEDLGILRVPGENVMDIIAQTEVDTVAVTHSTIAFQNSKFYREVQHEVAAHRTRISANVFPAPPKSLRQSPSYASMQASLLVYTLRRNVLGKAALVPWIGLFVVMLLLCILVAIAERSRGESLQNTCGVLFLLLSCSVQINSIFFKSELRDWRTFTSFRNNLYFTVLPFYVATMVRLFVPRLCFALVGWVCGAIIFAQTTAASVSAMMSLLSFAHACLGLIVVYWFPRLEMLMVANHVYYAYCVICCGFLMSVAQIPVFFQVLSLLRIAYGGVLANEVGSLTWCGGMLCGNGDNNASSTVTPDSFTGHDYLTLMGLQNDSLGKSALVLSLLSLILMAAVALSMYLSPSAKSFTSS
jgi:ABC-type multidrug transport system ATPase subunit